MNKMLRLIFDKFRGGVIFPVVRLLPHRNAAPWACSLVPTGAAQKLVTQSIVCELDIALSEGLVPQHGILIGPEPMESTAAELAVQTLKPQAGYSFHKNLGTPSWLLDKTKLNDILEKAAKAHMIHVTTQQTDKDLEKLLTEADDELEELL